MSQHSPEGAAVSALLRDAQIPHTPPKPGSREELALLMLEQLTGLGAALRQQAADRAWQTIPAHITEYATAQNPADGSAITIQPEFQTLVIVDRIAVFLPTGASATLQLGNRVYPNIGAGVTSWRCGELLGASDVRTLTVTGASAGRVSVALYGQQLAPEGTYYQ